ncbi:hypothetical protein COBT_002915 [Conglomerata obtusa]
MKKDVIISKDEYPAPFAIKLNHEFLLLIKVYSSLKKEKILVHQLFGIASHLCELNILNPEYWNTRTKIIKEFYGNYFWHSLKAKSRFMDEYEKLSLRPSENYNVFTNFRKERKPDFIKMELSWLKKCLKINYRNYQIWTYIGTFADLVKLEPRYLSFYRDAFASDPRNIHFWTFLLRYIKKRKEYKYGMEFTKNVIITDVYNNSAWALRLALIKKMCKYDFDVFFNEIAFVKSQSTGKTNLPLVNYLFGLNTIYKIGHILYEIYLRSSCDYFKYKFALYAYVENNDEYINVCLNYAKTYISLNKNLKGALLKILMDREMHKTKPKSSNEENLSTRIL